VTAGEQADKAWGVRRTMRAGTRRASPETEFKAGFRAGLKALDMDATRNEEDK